MKIKTGKGYLVRESGDERSDHVYRACGREDTVRRQMLNNHRRLQAHVGDHAEKEK